MFYSGGQNISITILTSTVCPSVHTSDFRHKKIISPNQQMLQINIVAYASVMKNITLGSLPHPQGACEALPGRL